MLVFGSALYGSAVNAVDTTVSSIDNSVTVKIDSTQGSHKNYDLSVDYSKVAEKVAENAAISYKANNSTAQTVTLKKGLDFTNGKNTTASVGADGVVKYDLNDDINLNSVTAKTINGDTIKAGADGINGAIGVKGADGKDGVTISSIGKDGTNGTDGHIGINGKNGASADIHVVKGANGVDGTDGYNGTDGIDRIVYEDHNGNTQTVATMNDGMKYGGDVGNVINKKLNGQVNVVGGITDSSKLSTEDNIGVVSDGSDNLKVRLAKDLQGISSISNQTTTGGTTTGTKITLGNTTNIVNVGGAKITNVAAGDVNSTSTDAVNGSQLYQTNQNVKAAKTVVKAGQNVTVTSSVGSDEQSVYTVNADLSSVASAIGGTSSVDTKTGAVKAGLTVNGNTYNNVQDAVNAANTTVSSTDGSVKVTPTNNTNGSHNYDVSVDYSKVAENAAISYKANNSTAQTVTLKKGLDFTNGKNTTASVGADGVVKYDLNDDINLNSVTAKTINGDTIKAGDTTITTGGMTIQNGSAGQDVTLNKDGLNNGGNKITNVAPGDISSTSTDAVNGSQLYGTETRINRLGNRINHVGAGAAALAGLHPLDFDPDDKWDFAAGYGNYKNANAVAIGAYYRPNEDTMFSVGGSFSGGENMVNVGVSWKFGQKSHISRSRVSMAKDMLAMKNQIETLTKKLAAYESGQPVKLAPIATGAMTFPDVPENHWAYEYVKNLAERGYLKGYPDGEFKGDRAMTRYEYAAIIYRALQNGAPSDGNMTRSVDDFGPELVKVQNINRFRVDRISGKDNDRHKVERVRVNDKDDKAQNVYRDVYGNHIQK